METLVADFSQIITDNGGQVAKSEYWGLRSLAYRIHKNRKGHYTLLNLDAPAAAVQEMERNMRLNEDVLRYLTLRTDSLEEGPSIVMQSRDERGRGDRGGRRGGGRGRDDRPRDDRPRDDRPRDSRPPRDSGADAPAKTEEASQ